MVAIAIPLACTVWFIKGGLASKILTAPILLITIFSYSYLGWGKIQDWKRGYNEQEKIIENIEAFKASGKNKIPLKNVIPFDWVAMCILHPYAGYAYEYPPSKDAVTILKSLGAEGFDYSNNDDGSDKYLFRSVDGEMKEFQGIFEGSKLISNNPENKLCFKASNTYLVLE